MKKLFPKWLILLDIFAVFMKFAVSILTSLSSALDNIPIIGKILTAGFKPLLAMLKVIGSPFFYLAIGITVIYLLLNILSRFSKRKKSIVNTTNNQPLNNTQPIIINTSNPDTTQRNSTSKMDIF